MNVRNFLAIAAIISIVFGLGLLLFPAVLMGLFSIRLEPGGIYVAQMYGADLLGLGVINWFTRNAEDLTAVLLGNFVGSGIGFLVSLFGILDNMTGVNALGWITVLLTLFVALGSAYYVFLAPGRHLRRVVH